MILRQQFRLGRLVLRMMKDDFKRTREPCPHCGSSRLRLERGPEHICFVCTYGAMWPETREKFGWGYDPSVSYQRPSIGDI